MATATSTVSYRPLASQRVPLIVFAVIFVLAVMVVVGFGVVALVGAHPDARDGRASVVLDVLSVIAAYLYLVRVVYRPDLHDGYLEVRLVLRRQRVVVDAVQEIRRTRFAIIKVRGRHRLQVSGGAGLQTFADASAFRRSTLSARTGWTSEIRGPTAPDREAVQLADGRRDLRDVSGVEGVVPLQPARLVPRAVPARGGGVRCGLVGARSSSRAADPARAAPPRPRRRGPGPPGGRGGEQDVRAAGGGPARPLRRWAPRSRHRRARAGAAEPDHPGWSDGTWTGGGRTWTWRGYDELRALLLLTEPAVRAANPYAADTLVGWCRLIGDLQDLAALVGEPGSDEPLLLDDQTRAALGAVRLDASVQKMRCQHVARQIRRRLGPELVSQVKIEATLSNMQGVVQGYAADADLEDALVGWQLQGSQFRLQMVLDGPGYRGTSTELRQRRVDFARQRPGWFDFAPLRQLTGSTAPEGPADTGEGLAFNRFDPNFVYRYLPVPGITVGEAVDAGFAYSSRAAVDRDPAG